MKVSIFECNYTFKYIFAKGFIISIQFIVESIYLLESTNSKGNEPYRNKNEHNDHQCINQNNHRPISSINKQQVQYQQHLACYTENERCEWILALQSASHRSMKQNLSSLRNQLRLKVRITSFGNLFIFRIF